ncbi:MAG: glycosyl hydrolase [Candidatus Fervidibacter sp.]|uniref:glycosyl hydrolase n=1 Tax=Candidatus Fervidibacter sp. TaxID=3100871 RepID=UPI00404A6A93
MINWLWVCLTLAVLGLVVGLCGLVSRNVSALACLLLLPAFLSIAFPQRGEAGEIEWAKICQESRPWTYWWWLGNAVTKEEITRHMELFKQVGLGGVHIIPIYGAQGYENRYIPYLSDLWLAMLAHTLQEGQRLGLGVDITLGTGWNMGGPWIDESTAAKKVEIRRLKLRQGEKLTDLILPDSSRAVLHALMAYGPSGQILDLTEKFDLKANRLNWTPPYGDWILYAVIQVLHGMKVKRAAPGGEGFIIDFFSNEALKRFLAPFDEAFEKLARITSLKPRAVYHDSFEVIGENWTDNLLDQFKRRRGYDLRFFLPALLGEGDQEIVSHVRSDFRQTIDELMLEEYVKPWVEWSHKYGFLVRYEAHGSPGNLLDLYGVADIPESETFGPDWLELVGLKPLPRTLPQRSSSNPKTLFLLNKFASSAAHVTGKNLCANETATWLGEHFKVPLEHVKSLVDLLFLAGINCIFYHGIPFSPSDEDFPGWLFYASTHFGPTNTFWRHFHALNEYISICQAFLQLGQPDNDLLVYFPVFDLWATDEGTRSFLHFLIAHSNWLEDNLPKFTQKAQQLWDMGYGFDFVSDRMLVNDVSVSGGQIQTKGGTYKALLIAGCKLMQPETLERIVRVIEKGATVLVVGELPKDVPGLGRLGERRQRFHTVRERLKFVDKSYSVKEARLGKGRLLASDDLKTLMSASGIQQEPMTDLGLQFIRRRESEGRWLYFIVNLSGQKFEGWVLLSVAAKSVVIFDPMGQRAGLAAVQRENEQTKVYLQLEPRQSLMLRATNREVKGASWDYWKPKGEPLPLGSEWKVEFVEGGPNLPRPTKVKNLTSWTEWTHDDPTLMKAFSGCALYRTSFVKPKEKADAWLLDLGTACYSARVWLNGTCIAALISSPFKVTLPNDLLREGENELAVEVANLMANRIAYMDKQGISWQRFFFVNIRYQPFSADDWEPLPSGLLGPVRLHPLARFTP